MAEAAHDRAHAPRRKHERIAAREDDFAEFRPRLDIAIGTLKLRFREQAAVRPDMLAPEAEAAIDRADQQRLQQDAVSIAVDDAWDGRERVIADRIRVFVRRGDALIAMRHELPADGVIRALDQRAEGFRYSDGVAIAHLGQRYAIRLGRQARGNQPIDIADRPGTHRRVSLPRHPRGQEWRPRPGPRCLRAGR